MPDHDETGCYGTTFPPQFGVQKLGVNARTNAAVYPSGRGKFFRAHTHSAFFGRVPPPWPPVVTRSPLGHLSSKSKYPIKIPYRLDYICSFKFDAERRRTTKDMSTLDNAWQYYVP